MSSFETAAKLLSDFKKEELLTNNQVIDELNKRGIYTNIRRLHSYIYYGIIRRPCRISKLVYHEKKYVLNAIACYLILREVFFLTQAKAKNIMSNCQIPFDQLLEKLVSLDKNMNYLQLKEKLC